VGMYVLGQGFFSRKKDSAWKISPITKFAKLEPIVIADKSEMKEKDFVMSGIQFSSLKSGDEFELNYLARVYLVYLVR
jgi:hypothetical protein